MRVKIELWRETKTARQDKTFSGSWMTDASNLFYLNEQSENKFYFSETTVAHQGHETLPGKMLIGQECKTACWLARSCRASVLKPAHCLPFIPKIQIFGWHDKDQLAQRKGRTESAAACMWMTVFSQHIILPLPLNATKWKQMAFPPIFTARASVQNAHKHSRLLLPC